uniref:Ubiquitin-conjugating enzyme E2 Z n=1 Tax=Neogobius melanostomus TaxID=47308 RepID=A0A8C6UCB4_9GOBI
MADSFGDESSGGGGGALGLGNGAPLLPPALTANNPNSGHVLTASNGGPSPLHNPVFPAAHSAGLTAVVTPLAAAVTAGATSPSSTVHASSPLLAGVGLGVAGTVAGAGGLLSQIHATSWDPTMSTDWDNEKASQQCILRIKRDIMSIYKEPPPGMFVVPDPQDMTKIHALITGPFDTPYEGGFFLFLFRLCLSILGTWTGPAWSPAQSISSVLISIQSLMTENPYHNEPGFEQERHPGDSKNYNECIRHETMRVAVCDMLEGKVPCPDALWSVMEKSFLEYYDFYEGVCKERLHLQGQNMQDPFGEKRGRFDYQGLLSRLGVTHRRIRDKMLSEEDLSLPGTSSPLNTRVQMTWNL